MGPTCLFTSDFDFSLLPIHCAQGLVSGWSDVRSSFSYRTQGLVSGWGDELRNLERRVSVQQEALSQRPTHLDLRQAIDAVSLCVPFFKLSKDV